MYRLKSKYLEYGDKAGKLLAYQLQKARASRLIPAIKSEKGEVLKTPLDINKRFKEYYESLYSSEVKPSPEDLDRFFGSIEMPVLPNEDREDLDRPISQSEIKIAIDNMASSRTPGEDGYSIHFF